MNLHRASLQLGDMCLRGFECSRNVHCRFQTSQGISLLQQFTLHFYVLRANDQLLRQPNICLHEVREFALRCNHTPQRAMNSSTDSSAVWRHWWKVYLAK